MHIPGCLLYYLLGKCILDVDIDVMMEFWMIAGEAIHEMNMRSERTRHKEGIG